MVVVVAGPYSSHCCGFSCLKTLEVFSEDVMGHAEKLFAEMA